MNIGIDIDNVISNFDETLLNEYIKHDKDLRSTGIVNKGADYIRRGMFDWTKDEEYRNDEYVYSQGRKISNIIFNEYIRKGENTNII